LLQEVPVPAQIKRFQPAIVSRIKISQQPEHCRETVPQDGRIKIRVKSERGGHSRFGHSDAAWRSCRHAFAATEMRALSGSIAGHGGARPKAFSAVLDMPHGLRWSPVRPAAARPTTLYSALHQNQ
jgi:general secretion pathway protein E/type IV pilus assembly protein PilB